VFKKLVVILFLTIYALSSFGFGVRQFYCCGKLKSTNISFIQETRKRCSNGDEINGCCKTTYKTFKVKDSHFAADGINHLTKHFTDLHLIVPAFEVKALANEPKSIANSSHAPPFYKVPIYIFNCVYRI
jgi:hypothetical protein